MIKLSERLKAAARNGTHDGTGNCLVLATDAMEAAKEIERMTLALRIVKTWATCDASSRSTRDVAMCDIAEMCEKGLTKNEKVKR